MAHSTSPTSTQELRLQSVHLANQPSDQLVDVHIIDGKVHSIQGRKCTSSSPADTCAPILLPSLCHSHVHLDKAFLLTSNSERYQDLAPTAGTFQEALSNTTQAKARYELADLEQRGSQLIAESVQAGVTSMRAFVEIDHTVGTKCLDVAVLLKKRFAADCMVQICAFAQDPIFSGPHGEENRSLLENALDTYSEIEVLGTTPYVEHDHTTQVKNIGWAVDTALRKGCHLDFHLDYNLDPNTNAAVWDVTRLLRQQRWPERSDKTVVLGHCTRLTLFSEDEMNRLAKEIRDAKLPISFVGLPTSDLYMMGRPDGDSWGGQRPRGTLQIPTLINTFGLNACLSLNNLGNAFTPHGSTDPLRLTTLGVAIYHAGTTADAHLLYSCVSTRARRAIGVDSHPPSSSSSSSTTTNPSMAMQKTNEPEKTKSSANASTDLELKVGDFVYDREWLLFENDETPLKMVGSGVEVPRRMRRSVQDVVWDPPAVERRRVVRLG